MVGWCSMGTFNDPWDIFRFPITAHHTHHDTSHTPTSRFFILWGWSSCPSENVFLIWVQLVFDSFGEWCFDPVVFDSFFHRGFSHWILSKRRCRSPGGERLVSAPLRRGCPCGWSHFRPRSCERTAPHPMSFLLFFEDVWMTFYDDDQTLDECI